MASDAQLPLLDPVAALMIVPKSICTFAPVLLFTSREAAWSWEGVDPCWQEEDLWLPFFGFFACLILVGKKKTFGFYICHSLFLAALVYNLIFFSKISFEFLFKICYKNFNNFNFTQYYQFFDSWDFFQFCDFLKEFQFFLVKPCGW